MAYQSVRHRIHDMEFAKEIPDDEPVHIPGQEAPLTLREEMRRFIVQELSRAAVDEGAESFEESDDFDVEEEPDLTSHYTVNELVIPDEPNIDDLEGEPTKEDLAAPVATEAAVGSPGEPSPIKDIDT